MGKFVYLFYFSVILNLGGEIMRIVAVFPDQRQVGGFVDSLRNIGLDRKDMIISDFKKEQEYTNIEDAAKEIIFIKSEREGLNELGTFANGITGLKSNEGIIVAVELPKHESDKVREIADQNGAIEILQD
jgi:hypothetical protein